jgi:hypothetical protein
VERSGETVETEREDTRVGGVVPVRIVDVVFVLVRVALVEMVHRQ